MMPDPTLTVWLVMFAAGLLTYATRLSFIVLFERIEVPRWLAKALRFVPPAVLTALVVPELLLPDERIDLSLGNPRLIAGLLAMLVAWRTRSVVITIIAGMASLLLLQLLLG